MTQQTRKTQTNNKRFEMTRQEFFAQIDRISKQHPVAITRDEVFALLRNPNLSPTPKLAKAIVEAESGNLKTYDSLETFIKEFE